MPKIGPPRPLPSAPHSLPSLAQMTDDLACLGDFYLDGTCAGGTWHATLARPGAPLIKITANSALASVAEVWRLAGCDAAGLEKRYRAVSQKAPGE